MRIGFLLNHDQVHQVAHLLPVAAAVARADRAVEPIVAVTSDRLADEAARLSKQLGAAPTIVRLGHRRPTTRALARLLDGLVPAAKLAIYRDNLDFFGGLDALVVAEKTSLVLKRRYGLALPMIHTRHGAGDRAIGFNRASAAFDHVLASGAKIRDRLIAEAGVAPARISVVGYPKFDLPPARPDFAFAHPERPVVLYNPHPAPHLSSWYRHGHAVLDHFARSGRFNLIFAPHVMLFHRPLALTIDPPRVARVGRIAPHVRRARNIHIDLGSPAATDMRYTDAADIYLGDVSSQVYEFLRHPRPCVFLDSHKGTRDGRADNAAWRAGAVIDDPALLGAALAEAPRSHRDFLPVQRDLIARTFDLTVEPSSDRAARAILAAVGRRPAAEAGVAGAPALAAGAM